MGTVEGRCIAMLLSRRVQTQGIFFFCVVAVLLTVNSLARQAAGPDDASIAQSLASSKFALNGSMYLDPERFLSALGIGSIGSIGGVGGGGGGRQGEMPSIVRNDQHYPMQKQMRVLQLLLQPQPQPLAQQVLAPPLLPCVPDLQRTQARLLAAAASLSSVFGNTIPSSHSSNLFCAKVHTDHVSRTPQELAACFALVWRAAYSHGLTKKTTVA